jgi:hypothetical protein
MRTALGSPVGVFLGEPLQPAQVDEFIGLMGRTVGGRRDRLELMGSYVHAVSACENFPFRVTDLAEVSRKRTPVTVKQLRNLLDDAAWDEGAIRRALVALIPLGSVEAFVIEYTDVITEPTGPTGYDIFSVTAVGQGFALPLGWRRARVPPADPPPGITAPDLSEEEHRCVSELLSDLGDDYMAVGDEQPVRVPPIIALDQRFGENEKLRVDLAARAPEYLLVVGPEYDEVDLARDPHEMVRPGKTIARQFGDWPHDAPMPRPRRVLTEAGRRGAEFAVSYRNGGATRFGLARPRVVGQRGSLLGRRPEQRVRALTEVASRLPYRTSASGLRIAGFRHQPDLGWRRHALLVSAAEAVASGRVTPGQPTPLRLRS